MDTYTYTSWGEPTGQTGSDPNPFRYGGQVGYYTDATSGLILCSTRWYAPALGRWLSRDPIGYSGGFNLYEYVSSNPVGLVDPSGLQEQKLSIWQRIGRRINGTISDAGHWVWDRLSDFTRPKMRSDVPVLGKPYLDPNCPETYQVNRRYIEAGQAVKNYIDETGTGIIIAAGTLRPLGSGVWESFGGLRFGPGGKQGHYLAHVMEHLAPNLVKLKHSVFDVQGHLIRTLDEAWAARGAGVVQGGYRVFDVNMGRVIGTAGETNLRIVVRNGTSDVITAYPFR